MRKNNVWNWKKHRHVLWSTAFSFFGVAVLFIPALISESANVSGTTTTIDVNFHAFQLTVVDLDADNDRDIVVADQQSNELAWYENNGSETFTKRSVATTWDATSVATSDIDKDGDTDIVASSFADNEVAWWASDGTPANGGWTKNSLTTTLTGAAGLTVADINADTNPDIVTTGFTADRLDWWQNDGSPGDGGWTQRAITTPNGAYDVAVLNLDGDSDLDVVGTGRVGDTVGLAENDGTPADGGWTIHSMTSLDGASGLDLGDIDGDSDNDLAVAGYDADKVVWYANNGTINAENWTQYDVVTAINQPLDVDIGDIDKDGYGDVAIANDNNTAQDTTAGIMWQENDSSPTNGGWTTRALISGTTRGNFAFLSDLDEDSDTDMIYGRPSSGMNWINNTNILPELVSAQISNRDTGNYLYPKRNYTFQIVAYDGNGATDIDKAYIQFTDANSRTHTLRWDNDAPTSCDTVSNPNTGDGYISVGSCSSNTSGNSLTVTFSNVTLDWDMPDSTNVDLTAYAEDEAGASVGYTTLQNDYFHTESETQVALADWSLVDSTINPSAQGQVNYTVAYKDSTITLADSVLTGVRVMRDGASSDTDVTATAGTSGSGTITLNAISTLGASTLSPRVVLADSDGGTRDYDSINSTLTIDRVQIISILVSGEKYDSGARKWDDNDGSGDALTVGVSAKLESAGTGVTGGRVVLGYEGDTDAYGAVTFTSFMPNSGSGTISIEENPASSAIITRENLTISSAVEGGSNEYGTEVNVNGANTVDVGWDNKNPSITQATVTESSAHLYYDSSATTLYFSDLMPATVNFAVSGTATDADSGLDGALSQATFSSEPSLAQSPGVDTSPSSFSGAYGVASASTGADSPLTVTITDNVGNSANVSASYTEDTTAPTYALSVDPAIVTDTDDSVTASFANIVEAGAGATQGYIDVFTTDSGTPTTSRTSWTITPGVVADGTYYFRGYAVDRVGNTGSTLSTQGSIDYINENPRAPTTGFDPANGVATGATLPQISWTAGSDPDPSDTASTLSYTLCIDNDGEAAQDCSQTHALGAGVSSKTLTTALTAGQWTYAVKTHDVRGGSSAYSDLQTFTVDPSLSIDFQATKTVGINVSSASGILPVAKKNVWDWIATSWALTNSDLTARWQSSGTSVVDVLGQRFIVDQNKGTLLQALNISNSGMVNYVIVGLLLLAFGYASGALSQRDPVTIPSFRLLPKRVFRIFRKLAIFFTSKPSNSFDRVAPKDASGTWLYSFSVYQRHHRLSRFTMFTAILVLVAKVVVVLGVSGVLLVQAHRVIGASPLQDDGVSVIPGDTLQYRIDYTNEGSGAATGTRLTDVLPTGTNFVSGSATVNGVTKTEAADSDTLTYDATTKTLTFNVGTVNVGDMGYVSYRVNVNEPANVTAITNSASLTSTEKSTPTNTNITNNPLASGSIGDLVWQDDDSDGAKDALEPGIKEMDVHLFKDNGDGAFDRTVDAIIDRKKTATNGSYDFTSLGVGTYFVDLNDAAFLEDYVVTTGNDPLKVTLSQGQDYNKADFGLVVSTLFEEPSPLETTPEETDEPSEETPEETETPDETVTPEESESPTKKPVAVDIDVVPSASPKDQPRGVGVEEVQRTITLQQIQDLDVPEEEKEILRNFTLRTFGTAGSRRLIDTAGGLSIRTKDDVIVLSGTAQPASKIELLIFSDPVKVTTEAQEDGVWEVAIAVNIFEPGTHRVLARVTDPSGRTSSQIEVAQIIIQREQLSQINLIIYIVLMVIIVVLTAIVVSMIYRRDSAKIQNRWQGLGDG